MAYEDSFKKVVEILSPFARNKEALDNVNGDSRIIDDLQVNSSRLVDIVLAMEDEFDIEIEDEEVEKVTTVGSAVELIEGKTG